MVRNDDILLQDKAFSLFLREGSLKTDWMELGQIPWLANSGDQKLPP